MIAFIDESYIRHNCLWMDFASNKPATNNFVYYVCHEAGGGVYTLWWNKGVWSHFAKDGILVKYNYSTTAPVAWNVQFW